MAIKLIEALYTLQFAKISRFVAWYGTGLMKKLPSSLVKKEHRMP